MLYGIAGIVINKKVDKFSKIELNSNSNLIRNIQESLSAIKEIIISNNHNFYLEISERIIKTLENTKVIALSLLRFQDTYLKVLGYFSLV